jgi:hypothetical protein
MIIGIIAEAEAASRAVVPNAAVLLVFDEGGMTLRTFRRILL